MHRGKRRRRRPGAARRRCVRCYDALRRAAGSIPSGGIAAMGAILQVLSKCSDPAREEEFNRWYNEVHLPDLLAIEHIVAAQRFKVAPLPGRPESDATYLAV